MRSRVLILLAMLLLASLVVAQSPHGPPQYKALKGDPANDIDPARCWDCHSPPATPPMDPYVAFTPTLLDFPADPEAPIQLETIISNVWAITSERDYDLRWFRATLDLRDAPSFSFLDEREPYEGPAEEGEIVIGPEDLITLDPQQLPPRQHVQELHGGHVRVMVPNGATEARITITPQDQDPSTGPDLIVDLYPGVDVPGGDPYNEEPIDAAGRGKPEQFHANLADFAAVGYGNWTIEALVQPIDAETGEATNFVQPIRFQVVVDAWFNASAATQTVQTSDAAIEEFQSHSMHWPLQVGTPGPNETLRFTLNLTVYYDHDGGDGWPQDWADLTETFEVPVGTAPTGAYRIGEELSVIQVPVPPGGASLRTITEIIGYIGAFLLVASVWTGGMFGKGSRRQLNSVFGSARRRVAFHNFLSYGIITFALVHMSIFVWDVGPLGADGFHWLVGVLWGGQGILAMLLLGVTGALQVPMIRRWNYGTWRWIHFGLAIAAIVFTITHVLLDGIHFSDIQDAIGWNDPLVPAGR